MGSGAGPFAAAQVQLRQSLRGPRRSARRKASPLVSASPWRRRWNPAGDQPRQRRVGLGQAGRVRAGRARLVGLGLRRVRQEALPGVRRRLPSPWRSTSSARPSRQALSSRPSGAAARPSPGPAGVAAGRRDDSARPGGRRQAATRSSRRRGKSRRACRPPARVLRPAPATVAHPRLLRLGAFEEQVEQRQHQGLARSAGNAARGRSRAGQPASPRPASRSAPQASAETRCHGDVRASPGLRRRPAGWRTADSAW